MKILFTLYFCLATNIISADYSSESSGKETYKFSIDTIDGYSTEIRKTEGTWTDSLGNYGLNTCVGTIFKEKEKLNLALMCEYVNQEKQKNWSKLYRKKTIEDSVIKAVEYIEATDKYKFLVEKKFNYAVKFYDKSFFFLNINALYK
ncbi:hypothetical protein N9V56_01350 [Alphaproteobacteria bacterium]|nr:hypothetical protein [Alphaproteobacteria bacterium]